MAKGRQGGTRTGSSSAPTGLLSKGDTSSFPVTLKLSDFYDEGQFLNGGAFSAINDDGHELRIDIDNGYNDDIGATGATVQVSIRFKDGRTQLISNDFIEGEPFVSSGGARYYPKDNVIRRLNNSMPYYIDRANYWIKREKG